MMMTGHLNLRRVSKMPSTAVVRKPSLEMRDNIQSVELRT